MKSKVAIVAANYYENITSDLVDGVKNNLNKSFDTTTYFVDGAWEIIYKINDLSENDSICLLYTSPSPRDLSTSRMPSSA